MNVDKSFKKKKDSAIFSMIFMMDNLMNIRDLAKVSFAVHLCNYFIE